MNQKTVVLIFNDDSSISINIETYLDNNLKIGKDIDVNNILNKDAYYNCYFLAIKLLKQKDYSIKSLKFKLNKKFNNEIVDRVIDKLISLNILDEHSFAINLINNLIDKNYGPNKIIYELKNKQYDVDYFKLNEFKFNIEKCAFKYLKTHQNLDNEKLKYKLYQYLLSKGYNNSDIIEFFQKGGIFND